jgi:UDP-3-O-[3-hydroxymyristoyl] glucosamine N-acyltransferase
MQTITHTNPDGGTVEVLVGKRVHIGQRVQIGVGCEFADDVSIGDDTVLCDRVRAEPHVHIGRSAWIGPNVVIKDGAWLGDNVVVGHDIVIGPRSSLTGAWSLVTKDPTDEP